MSRMDGKKTHTHTMSADAWKSRRDSSKIAAESGDYSVDSPIKFVVDGVKFSSNGVEISATCDY